MFVDQGSCSGDCGRSSLVDKRNVVFEFTPSQASSVHPFKQTHATKDRKNNRYGYACEGELKQPAGSSMVVVVSGKHSLKVIIHTL